MVSWPELSLPSIFSSSSYFSSLLTHCHLAFMPLASGARVIGSLLTAKSNTFLSTPTQHHFREAFDTVANYLLQNHVFCFHTEPSQCSSSPSVWFLGLFFSVCSYLLMFPRILPSALSLGDHLLPSEGPSRCCGPLV